ncbi:hypothetical protein G4H71_07745 [Rhodococcus triatomae]|uniref:DUF4232 domain-containing protein n=1 Tax=Rhodococcus triatomae TaxID=300028 RepID=A0A1G8RVR6_9NOCA|nr:hypothetical protein [Rhodococcus triatomae]QNG17387.1 hypothetical protein G4H72_00300 [Rhodococcus triatomae]QNG22946.1 hypothetical protein G4H71_07745 [Rhodococcus triatomae]SDJ21037.1 hypothetical protein SAMN05444695_11913 [Rhodococcus triatomae]
MFQPNGPLPPEIYWRRRALALGAIVLALILVVWLIVSLRGGSETAEAGTTGVEVDATPTSVSASATSSANSGSGSGGSGGGSGSSDDDRDDDSETTATSETSSTPAPPVAPGQCADQSLAIKVSRDKPTYPAGEEPTFTTIITNIGDAQCDRDLGSGFQQVLVYSLDGNRRLWSNTDCFPQTEPDVRSLAPGEQAVFNVKWSVKTSTPECVDQPEPVREPVGPGAYTVVGQIGELRSAPEPFNLG